MATWLRIQDGTMVNTDILHYIEIKGMKVIGVEGGDGWFKEFEIYKNKDVDKLVKVYEELSAAIANYDINKMEG